MQIDGGSEDEPKEPKRTMVQVKVLDKILTELIFDSKGEVRSAACVWLVSLCTFTGRQPELLQRLPQIQEAFSNLLGDSSELAQVQIAVLTLIFMHYCSVAASSPVLPPLQVSCVEP